MHGEPGRVGGVLTGPLHQRLVTPCFPCATAQPGSRRRDDLQARCLEGVARAHELGLKILIDQVYAHTSDEHPWFIESRSSRDNPKADWYVWHDAKPDGSPPNNWQSVFGGPAWTWDARRGQYYMHNFLREQPQFHVHNPDVQDAIIAVAKFWLDRGVDGFRIDAINFSMHDPSFRDNPPTSRDVTKTRPFDFQDKIYNQGHPDIVKFLEKLLRFL